VPLTQVLTVPSVAGAGKRRILESADEVPDLWVRRRLGFLILKQDESSLVVAIVVLALRGHVIKELTIDESGKASTLSETRRTW
jgi:hypothetical protein